VNGLNIPLPLSADLMDFILIESVLLSQALHVSFDARKLSLSTIFLDCLPSHNLTSELHMTGIQLALPVRSDLRRDNDNEGPGARGLYP
jgi:hypothetical protein